MNQLESENRHIPRWRRWGLLCIGLLVLCNIGVNGRADEYSLLNNSSVIGQNYGLPVGEPYDGVRGIGEWSFFLETVFFAKNLELTGSQNIDGETFFGALAPMRFNFLATENIQIELGGYFGSNYGDDSLDISEPLVRLIYQPRENHYVVVGSIFQTHWIHDGLRDDIAIFRDASETGFQYRVDQEWFKADYWLDWRVREKSDRAEEFDGAMANQLRWMGVWIDGQVFWSHTGGQLNNTGQVANNANGMVGISYGRDVLGPRCNFRVGGAFLTSHSEARNSTTTDGEGVEYWANCKLELPNTSQLLIYAKHFEGEDFRADRGDPLYQFDQYSQVGFDWLTSVRGELAFEIGFVGQYADDNFMNTYKINFVWQKRFDSNRNQYAQIFQNFRD